MNASLEAAPGRDESPRREREVFDRALVDLRRAVGSPYVLTGDEDVRLHSRVTIPTAHMLSAVVRPANVGEVQATVRIANEHRLAVWPSSRGNNWGYGSKTATHAGAIALLLDRMDRIVEVDEELAYAVVEPGVTQRQLNEELKSRGGRLWADCTDSTPEGSVLGNALERGLGYTRYGDHFGCLCGLEVVLPDGSLVHTGGAPADSPTRHTFKWGTGPYLEGLFSQSNLGIVTRAGIWLMPAPESFNSIVFEVRREEDLPRVIDAFRRLALLGAVQSNLHMVNDMLLVSLLAQYPRELLDGGTCLSAAARAELRRRYRIGPWTMVGGLYGTRAQVRAHRAAIRKELGRYGRLQFASPRKLRQVEGLARLLRRVEGRPVLSRLLNAAKDLLVGRAPREAIEILPQIAAVLQGIPGERIVSCAYFKHRGGRPERDVNPARDGCGLTWFAPVVPLTGEHTERVLGLCRPLFDRHGLDFAMSFILVNPRSMVMLMEIAYDREDADETRRAAALYEDLCEATIAAGYQQYRTGVTYMDRILAESPDFARLAATLKVALDPANVLAPGRYGVGPRRTTGE